MKGRQIFLALLLLALGGVVFDQVRGYAQVGYYGFGIDRAREEGGTQIDGLIELNCVGSAVTCARDGTISSRLNLTLSSNASLLGASIDDTELTAEDFGDWTCNASEDGCTIDANAVQGTDISVASEATGDLMCFNGTDWVRVAAGTTGQVLTGVSSACPTFQAAASSVGLRLGGHHTTSTNADRWYDADFKTANTSEAPSRVALLPVACTLRALYVKIQTAPGAGSDWTITVLEDGVSTGIDCVISGASDTTCNELVTTNPAIAGSFIAFQFDANATPPVGHGGASASVLCN